MSTPSLHVAIFSYNRGAYLKNCVDSLQRNMPGIGWTVYDDGSDELETVAYLQTLGEAVQPMKSAGDDRHGGYYNNIVELGNELGISLVGPWGGEVIDATETKILLDSDAARWG